MTRRSSAALALAALLLVETPAAATCPTTPEPYGQAAWLRERGEHYRAAGVYLDALYTATARADQVPLWGCLAETYLQADQPERAYEAMRELATAWGPATVPPEFGLNLAYLHVRGASYAVARQQLTLLEPTEPALRLRRDFLAAMAAVGTGDLDTAATGFASVSERCGRDRSSICLTTRRNLGLLTQPPDPPSAGVALALSAVLPGAGMVYTEHHVDAVIYGGAFALFGFMTFDTIDWDRDFAEQPASAYLLGTLTLMVYTSNLIASHGTAARLREVQEHNYRQDMLRHPSLPFLPLPTPPP